MLIHSSLLLWTVIQVVISGSQAKPHATKSEDDACVDISLNCASNAFQCETSSLVQTKCPKTCNLCPDPMTVQPTTTEVTDFPTTQPPPTTDYPDCGGDYISRSGTIRHPIHGKSYQNNENCVWTITTGEPINITFVSFDIEDSYDFLYISDVHSIDSRMLGNFTGSSLPSPVEENTGAASIFFSSDHSLTLTRFILEWQTLDPLTTPTTTTEVTDPEPTQPPSECGGNYTSRSGTFRHPMNGIFYQNTENCVWTITTEEPINITFVSFYIEDSYDYLIIRDGNSNDSPVLGNYTGSSLPSPVVANLGPAYLLFTSDHSVFDTGFVLQWETLDPLTTPTPTITVTDPLTTQTTTPEVTDPDPAKPSSRPPTCTDISPNCAINALPFQCNNNAYVQERCQKSCNLC